MLEILKKDVGLPLFEKLVILGGEGCGAQWLGDPARMKYRRRWSRFKALNQDKVQAQIEKAFDRSGAIKTVGLGGCAFVTNRKNARLLLNPDVKIQLSIAGRRFEVEGRVHYCKFLPDSGMDANLLGIEFMWSSDQERSEFGQVIGKAVSEGYLEQLQNIEV